MPVPNHAVTSVRQVHALHACQERVSLGLDRLGQQPAGAAADSIWYPPYISRA